MSELNADDLHRMEIMVRAQANDLRTGWPESLLADPTAPAEVKAHARRRRAEADDFDQIGNLLVGLQGDWTKLGPMVRQGYVRMRREFEELQRLAEQGKEAERVEPAEEEQAA